MKTLSVLVAFLALAASPLVAAQSATVPTDDVGHTGTDTAVIQTVPTDDVGHTGTDTAVIQTVPTDDVGHTGTDTVTTTMAAPASAPPLSLQAASSSMVGPNTMKVTAIISASPNSTSTVGLGYSAPLASSDPACTVPASVDLSWTSSRGGTAAFSATCTKVSADKTITISSGSASTHFVLKRSR
jgi:hypothetical protein